MCLHANSLQSCPILCDPIDYSKNTGVGCQALLQGIFLIQGLNWCLLWLQPSLQGETEAGALLASENLLWAPRRSLSPTGFSSSGSCPVPRMDCPLNTHIRADGLFRTPTALTSVSLHDTNQAHATLGCSPQKGPFLMRCLSSMASPSLSATPPRVLISWSSSPHPIHLASVLPALDTEYN